MATLPAFGDGLTRYGTTTATLARLSRLFRPG